MERCPTCRARLRDTPSCPRCGTELARLQAIEAGAMRHLGLAVAHLRQGDEDVALREIEHSLRLKREPLALVLRAFILNQDQCQLSRADIPVADWFWRQESPDIPSPYPTNHP